jgi:ssRNA-specific RNase YbeY (16S rRNA maturation enzyme)
MIHAVLHLLGFDHTKDNGQMETMQSDIVERLHEKFGKED